MFQQLFVDSIIQASDQDQQAVDRQIVVMLVRACWRRSCRSATAAAALTPCTLPSAVSVCCPISPGTSCCFRAATPSSANRQSHTYLLEQTYCPTYLQATSPNLTSVTIPKHMLRCLVCS